MDISDMDFVFYRDATETALNNFKIQDYHKNGDTVLKMFVSIGDIIYDSLDTKGYIQTNNFLMDGSDAVYRRLNVIAQFLNDVKPLHLLSFRNFDRVKINEIKWTIKDILKAISPHFFSFEDLKAGFQFKRQIYLISHHYAYSSIGKLLHKFLDFVKDFPDLTEWKPSNQLLFIKCQNERVHIKSDKKVITLSNEVLATSGCDIHEIAKFELRLFCRKDVKISSLESYDWKFEEYSTFENTPLAYVYKCCSTVDKLLETARYFQHKVAIKPSFSYWGILWIVKMCNALLLRGYFCRKKLNLQNIIDLLNVVFSMVDRLVPETITTKSNQTFILTVYEQIIWTRSIFLKYEAILLEHNNSEYPFYFDYIYKFISVYFNHYRHIIPELQNYNKLIVSRTVIHRLFLPNEIGSEMKYWNLKFEEYSNVRELLFLAEEDLRCTICQKDLVLDQTEIAIPERCNHLSCSSCLMEGLNVITKDSELETLPKSFSCPNSSCEMKHTGFITDGHYNRLRSEALKAMYNLD